MRGCVFFPLESATLGEGEGSLKMRASAVEEGLSTESRVPKSPEESESGLLEAVDSPAASSDGLPKDSDLDCIVAAGTSELDAPPEKRSDTDLSPPLKISMGIERIIVGIRVASGLPEDESEEKEARNDDFGRGIVSFLSTKDWRCMLLTASDLTRVGDGFTHESIPRSIEGISVLSATCSAWRVPPTLLSIEVAGWSADPRTGFRVASGLPEDESEEKEARNDDLDRRTTSFLSIRASCCMLLTASDLTKIDDGSVIE
jgi:hypothetical protein